MAAPAVTLVHHGHACVALHAAGWPTVVVDPYRPGGLGGRIGLPPPQLEPDVVAITHDHEDHAWVPPAWADARVVAGPGGTACGVRIEAVPVYHDAERGTRMGLCDALVLHYAGLRVVHLGDVGEPIADARARRLAGADVLVVPAGGTYTLDPAGACALVARLQPRLAIAVHLADPAIDLPLRPAAELLAIAGDRAVGWRGGTLDLTDALQTMPGRIVVPLRD